MHRSQPRNPLGRQRYQTRISRQAQVPLASGAQLLGSGCSLRTPAVPEHTLRALCRTGVLGKTVGCATRVWAEARGNMWMTPLSVARRWVRAPLPPLVGLLFWLVAGVGSGGCTTIRITDPPRTATEQFLLTTAAAESIDQLSAELLRDRRVFIDTQYIIPSWQVSPEQTYAIDAAAFRSLEDKGFLVAELRARLMKAGVRIATRREDASIVLEIRTGGVGVDREEFLLGIPSLYLPANQADAGVATPTVSPELSIVKSTRQFGYASVGFVAYWQDTGELVFQSGPFVGQTRRTDWWFFGWHTRPDGDIPTVNQAR